MKKLLKLSAFYLIVGIVFVSCRSNTSIAKRHYNNGYYIAHSKGKQHVKQNTEETNVSQLKMRSPVYSVPTVDQANSKISLLDASPVASVPVSLKSDKFSETKSTSAPKKNVAHRISSVRPFVKPIERFQSQAKKAVVRSDDDGGLSLFWIIILILLILWALGFLGGYIFGGLINLLLVVALILLILWLLRII